MREDKVEGPSSGAGHHGLCEFHVKSIDVGQFFSIDLNRDESIVHKGAYLFVSKAFSEHHMTPVAGGVANGEEDWFIFFAGFFESFITPWVPIDSVVGAHQEIGRFLIFKSICMAMFVHITAFLFVIFDDPNYSSRGSEIFLH